MSAATRLSSDPDETRPILQLADDVVEDAAEWLCRPHPFLGGKTPNELIQTGQEGSVRSLLRAIKHGMFS